MERIKPILRHRFFLPGLAVLIITLSLAGFCLYRAGVTPAVIKGWVEELQGALSDRPLLLAGAMIVLPGLCVPISAMMMLAGAVWLPLIGPFPAVVLTVGCAVLCMTWCFFLGAGPLRGLVEKQLERKNYDLPSLSRTNALRLTLIVRLTPALPFLFQNYFLGFMRVPFRTFILVSASVHTMYAVGFVIFGGSIFQGKAGVAVIALMVIVVAILLARMLYGWLRRREALRMESASCANEASPVGSAEGGGGGDA